MNWIVPASLFFVLISQLSFYFMLRSLRNADEMRNKRLVVMSRRIDLVCEESKTAIRALAEHGAPPDGTLTRLADMYADATKELDEEKL